MDVSARPYVLCDSLTVLDEHGRPIVRDLTLAVAPGEIVALVGRSGSGKSTVASVLFGTNRRRLSTIGAHTSLRGRGSLVLQHAGRVDHLRPSDELRLLAPEIAAAALDEYPTEVNSGGERRKHAVHRALVTGPEIIWLDEPCAGLDQTAVDSFVQAVTDLRHGVAMVLVSHQLPLVRRLADRVVILGADGRARTVDRAEWDQLDSDAFEQMALTAMREPGPAEASADAGSASASGAGEPKPVERPRDPWRPAAVARSMWRLVAGDPIERRTALEAGRLAVRGALFTLAVGAIVGVIVPLLLAIVVPALDVPRWVAQEGSNFISRISPPFGAVLAVASGGASVGAWWGALAARQEHEALAVLRHDAVPRLATAAAVGLAGALAVVTLAFGAGIVVSWTIQFGSSAGAGMLDGFAAPGRVGGVTSTALMKTLAYAACAALVVVRFCRTRVHSAADIGRAIAHSTVVATLLVVLVESGALAFEKHRAVDRPYDQPLTSSVEEP